jgi:hypothetical protein
MLRILQKLQKRNGYLNLWVVIKDSENAANSSDSEVIFSNAANLSG